MQVSTAALGGKMYRLHIPMTPFPMPEMTPPLTRIYFIALFLSLVRENATLGGKRLVEGVLGDEE